MITIAGPKAAIGLNYTVDLISLNEQYCSVKGTV